MCQVMNNGEHKVRTEEESPITHEGDASVLVCKCKVQPRCITVYVMNLGCVN